MRDRVFSKGCQKIIEMSEPEKGQRSVYQESGLLTKRTLRNKVIFLTDRSWQAENEKINCAHFLDCPTTRTRPLFFFYDHWEVMSG